MEEAQEEAQDPAVQDPAVEIARASHALEGYYYGQESVAEMARIRAARPRGNSVRAWARRHHGKGLRLTEHPNGKFDIAISSLKLKLDWHAMQDPARRLSIERSERELAGRPYVTARNPAGQRVSISATSEAHLKPLLRPLRHTFSPGLPRCELGDPHDYRANGRCFWCGRFRDGSR